MLAKVVMRFTLALLATLAVAGPVRAQDDHGGDATSATILTSGVRLSGRITPRDRDWFRFALTAGDDVVITTTSPTPMDTVLSLYDTDGRTRLAFDDDGGGGRASRIAWRAPRDGTFFAMVAHYHGTVGLGSYTIGLVRTTSTPPATSATLTLSAPPVFDPKLEDAGSAATHVTLPIDYTVGPAGSSFVMDMEARDAQGNRLATILAAAPVSGGTAWRVLWDGRAPLGVGGALIEVDPGDVTIRLIARATASGPALATLDRTVRIARLGVSQISLAPTTGALDEFDWIFHRQGGRAQSYAAVFASDPEWRLQGLNTSDPGDLDHMDGKPRPSPLPWSDLGSGPPTPTHSLPALLAAGSTPRLTLTLGSRPVSRRTQRLVASGYPLAGTPLRAVVNGIVLAMPAGASIQPGGTLSVTLPALGWGLGRTDIPLSIAFEALVGGAWVPVPGRQQATLRAYTLLGEPVLSPYAGGFAAPYLPWLAVVDEMARASNGQAMTDAQVATLASNVIWTTSGLSYDTTAGAPSYALGALDDLELDLSAYLARGRAVKVNCSDCGTLAATYANMVGGSMEYAVMGFNFDLYMTKSIGASRFVRDPFGSAFRGAFAFHTVSTRDGASTIHDACLALDGDGNPDSSPHAELLPRGLAFPTYRDRLSPTGFGISTVKRPRLR